MADNLRNKGIPFTRRDFLIYGNMKNLFVRFYGFYFFYFMHQCVKVGGNRTCLKSSMICYPTF